MKIKFMLDEGAYAPTEAHKYDAGFDLRTPYGVYLKAYDSINIDTGVHVLLPEGSNLAAYLISKSGLMCGFGIESGLGLIDSGYTGSIVAHLVNNTSKEYYFKKGDKVTQLVITSLPEIELVETKALLEKTERGSNGFGSSGK